MNVPAGRPAAGSAEQGVRAPSPPPVIAVGVEGTSADRYPIQWAARTARARGLPLRLIHAHPHRIDLAVTERAHAAEDMARELAPGVTVRLVVAGGEIDHVLVEQSVTAHTLVLARSPGRPLEGFSFDHSTTVAAAARCPVVVVPRIPGRLPPDHGAVVVGVDGTEVSEAALAFALDHAAVLGADLLAVHSWQDDAAVSRGGPAGIGGEAVIDAEERVLAERLAGWQTRYPDVRINRVVTHGRAADALLKRAETAQLLVVGSTGRSGLDGLLHGSTSQALLYQATCPLAIVRRDHEPG